MLVRDWMTADPVSVTPDTPVMDALRILKEGNFRRLPVVDGSQLVGITTRKDLKDAMPSKATTLSVWELNYLLSKLTVSEMMARPVITAAEGEYMEDAALRMQEHHVGGLPVLSDSGRLSGIITTMDVLRAFTGILGMREGGQRLTLDMPDVPGSLERATQAILPSNIISVATYGGGNGYRRFVMRVNGEGVRDARRRVHDAGITVLD
ncbi:acetoin dehydrogenase [Deinococcus malanensis]|uniref:Acetoin dehydrogenase n=1 Tax=Deinococcus malanensis TaxID=1706855 RepID=A0ABQ2F204_9DEIO|nr:CBS and ACT domain-containing protein [Deinococcus malanensis]GGK32405.1 acetoin dehydrogenase [Deinococcus malanensis]